VSQLPQRQRDALFLRYDLGFDYATIAETLGVEVVDTATRVEISFSDGTVLRLPTFGGPSSLGRVRFYASELPPGVSPTSPTRRSSSPFIDKLAGFDGEGNVVACLVPRTAAEGISPLSDCG
jgi:hypothetical protein